MRFLELLGNEEFQGEHTAVQKRVYDGTHARERFGDGFGNRVFQPHDAFGGTIHFVDVVKQSGLERRLIELARLFAEHT